jgi:transaldolase / glucose-6-phosphate isomerase
LKTRAATTFGYGPRYLHSTGQLHKGGPNSVVVIGLVGGDERPIPVPGAQYDFAALSSAQFAGDMEALIEGGRRVATRRLTGDYAAGIRLMARSVV